MRRTSSRLARACAWGALVVVALAFATVALGVATDRWHIVATENGSAALLVEAPAAQLSTGDDVYLTDGHGNAEIRPLRRGEKVEGLARVPSFTVPLLGRVLDGAGRAVVLALFLSATVALGCYALTGSFRRRIPIGLTSMVAVLAVATPALASFSVPAAGQPQATVVFAGGTVTAPSGLSCTWTGASALSVNWSTPSPSWAQGQQLQRKAYPGAMADYGSLLSSTATTTSDSSATTPSATKYTYRLYGKSYLWTSPYSSEISSQDCAGTITSVSPPTSSQADAPEGIFYWEDTNGNPFLFVADTGNNVVRKIDLTTQVVSRVMGTGAAGFNEPCSPASSCQLNAPEGVYVKTNGDVLIADSVGHRIRKVTAAGVVSTIAGTGSPGFTGDGAAATAAKLDRPVGITMVGSDIYISDKNNNRIRKFTDGGNISTEAGTGTSGFADATCNPTPANCMMNAPELISADASGNIYIADRQNNRVRVYSTSAKTMSTLAGGATAGFADGTALAANMDKPEGVWVIANGDVYVADRDNNRIRKISVAPNPDTISTVAGSGTPADIGDGFAATASNVQAPRGVAVSPAGQLYFSDTGHNGVRRITTAGNQQTVLGNSAAALSGDGSVSVTWRQVSPRRIAPDASGNIYIADYTANIVRKWTGSTGDVSIVAGNGVSGSSGDGAQATAARLNGPAGVAVSGTNLYIADQDNHKVRKVDLSTGIISTFAGTGSSGYTGEGAATSFRLNQPSDVAVASNGDVYIADSANNRIRKVSGGNISTYAGNGTAGSGGDGSAATSANLNLPVGIGFDTSNNLYIADNNNQKVRLVTAATGNISTFAGTGTAGSTGDGGTPAAATLNGPCDVVVNGSSVYIAARTGNRIRKVTANVISTILGTGTASSTGDGGRYVEATTLTPCGLAFGSDGNFFVSEDASTGAVRKVQGGL